jgi:hypothetical protein
VVKKAENQRKSKEKSKVVENQVLCLDFCAKKKDCAYTLGNGSALGGLTLPWPEIILIEEGFPRRQERIIPGKLVLPELEFFNSLWGLGTEEE